MVLAEDILPPEQVFRFHVERAPDTQYLRIDIKAGYYLYANKLQLEAQTPLTWERPQGTFKEDPYFGRVEIYQGNVIVPFSTKATELDITYQGCKTHGVCYPPQKTIAALPPLDKPWIWTILSFAGMGLLLAFTPCVLPMAPILSAMLVGQKNTVAAFFSSLSYVLGVASAYALAGMISARLGAFLGVFLQSDWVLALSALLIAFMGILMLGSFEWRFFSRWQTPLARMSNHMASLGYAGIFISGLLSALILSPCVAPPLAAALTYIAQTGHVFQGSMTLFAMGLGMGIPLLLLGSSLGWLLPKSGKWMHYSYRVGGILLLGLALWLVRHMIPPAGLGLLVAALVLALPWLLAMPYGKKIYPVFLLLASLSFWQTSQWESLQSHQAFTDLEKLQTTIANTKKPVLLKFYADWCVSCRELDEALQTPKVSALLARYQIIRIDLSNTGQKELQLLRHYGLYGPPALVIHHGEQTKGPLVGLPDTKTLYNFLETG
jgi:thiol:disulfide interchange protein DsbD